jgi:hypothetical protein
MNKKLLDFFNSKEERLKRKDGYSSEIQKHEKKRKMVYDSDEESEPLKKKRKKKKRYVCLRFTRERNRRFDFYYIHYNNKKNKKIIKEFYGYAKEFDLLDIINIPVLQENQETKIYYDKEEIQNTIQGKMFRENKDIFGDVFLFDKLKGNVNKKIAKIKKAKGVKNVKKKKEEGGEESDESEDEDYEPVDDYLLRIFTEKVFKKDF